MPRPKGSPNKLTSEIKEKLAAIVSNAIASIDIDSMTQNEKLKLTQIGLTYVIPRLKQVEDVSDEMPTNFQIEIIDSLSKYSDKELDNAIKN
ncbi:MAG: hypothetical protein HOE70_00075 [Flavobacteriaceae bacterium]|nr:hypothetical protein [Flavobacteriaceae bacterium]